MVHVCRIYTALEVAKFLDMEFDYGHVWIHTLPVYSPNMNPYELVWPNVKWMVSQKFFNTKDDLLRLFEADFKSPRDLTDKVTRFLKEPDCQYILA